MGWLAEQVVPPLHQAQSPEDFLRCWRPVRDEFNFEPRTFKRMKPPEGLHPEAAPWYPMRSFYIYRNLRDFRLLKSPALVDEIASGFQRLTPLYRFITAIPCEEDPDETRENPNLAWKDFAF